MPRPRTATSWEVMPPLATTASASPMLRVLVRMKQVEPGRVEARGDLVGVQDGHDRDVVHGLRPGGVVVEHSDSAAGVAQRLTDALPSVGFHA